MTACGECIRYGIRVDLSDACSGMCPVCKRDSSICRNCGGRVEPERWIYATPVCFKCLPPPKPLKTPEEP